jgi:ribose transport system permease protein
MRKLFQSKGVQLLLIAVVLAIGFELIDSHFLSVSNLKNIMISSSLSGTIMIGMSCLLISGNVDMASGSVGCLAGIIAALLINAGCPWGLAALVALCYGAVAGALNAALLYVFDITPFIGTLGAASIWEGLSYILTHNTTVNLSNVSFFRLGTGELFGLPMPFVIFLALAIIYGVMLYSTNFGRHIYMAGGNRTAARLAGISIPKVGTIMMINCSVISSIAGIVLAARMNFASPTAVRSSTMDSITAAILGGVSFMGGAGTTAGAFVGLMLLNVLTNGLNMVGIPSAMQIIASNLLLIVALTVDHFNEKAMKKRLKEKAA